MTTPLNDSELSKLVNERNNTSRGRPRADLNKDSSSSESESNSDTESEHHEDDEEEDISDDGTNIEKVLENPVATPPITPIDSNSTSTEEEDDDPLTALEIKKKLLTLAIEIKSLELQMPTVAEALESKRQHVQSELELTQTRAVAHKLENDRRAALDPWETTQAVSQMPRLVEQTEKRQELDILRLDHGITDLTDQRTRKRKNLEMDTEITYMETQYPKLVDLVKLRNDCEILRLKNDIEFQEFRQKRQKKIAEIETSHLDLAAHEVKNQLNDWAPAETQYLMDPVRKNRQGELELIVSDRVVQLHGPIVYRTADYISQRINYFDNKDSKLPIFLIIDYSPGGSVMAGFRILKAMESSKAPIYVLVKSFAASMAASITSLAKRSYILPNAEILHHQIAHSPGYGNLTQQREQLALLEQWWDRAATPIANRLGLTLEQWRQRLYENNSGGDWCVFGDKAVELNWVDQVVDKVRMTGETRNPDWWRRYVHRMQSKDAPQETVISPQVLALRSNIVPEPVEESDQEMRQLPALRPRDCYLIYNTNNYYTVGS